MTYRDIPIKALCLSVEEQDVVRLADEGDGSRRVRIVVNSGKPFDHMFFIKLALDMSGANIGRQDKPVFRDHKSELIAGKTEKIWVDEALRLLSEVRISQTQQAGKDIIQLQDEINYPWQASPLVIPTVIEEVKAGQVAMVNGYKMVGPGAIFREFGIREISVCPMGCDEETSVERMMWRTTEEANMEGKEKTAEVQESPAVAQLEVAATPEPIKMELGQTDEEGIVRSVEAERARCAEVVKQVGLFKLDGAVALELITEGYDTKACLAIMKARKEVQLSVTAPGSPGPALDIEALDALKAEQRKEALSAEEQWDKDKDLRKEFGDDKGAYLAFLRHEGDVHIITKG